MSDSKTSEWHDDAELNQAIGEFERRQELGEVDRTSFLAEFAGVRTQFAEYLENRDHLQAILQHDDPLLGRDFGKYRILRRIGSGGMGVVYLAQQQSPNRPVALKIMQVRLDDERGRRRFQHEADIAGSLQHENICRVFDAGEWNGIDFFVMEHIEGANLKDFVPQGGLPVDQAIALMIGVANGVAHAHEHGLIHRDLKPSNVLIDNRGQPHVADFGLAKRIDGNVELTGDSELIGTAGFSAPEQALGKREEVGTRSDVYSLGAVLYFLLTGQPPFDGPSKASIRKQVIHSEPKPPGQLRQKLPRDLETICLKCLHKEPAGRYATVVDFRLDLERFQRGEPVTARRAGITERGWRWCRRNPLPASLLSLCGALAISLLAMIAWNDLRLRTEAVRGNTYLAIARKPVDQLLDELKDDPRLIDRGVDPRDRLVLASAQELYERVAQEPGQELDALARRARANLILGIVAAESGSPSNAIAHVQRSCDIWVQLNGRHPKISDNWREQAVAFRHLGYHHFLAKEYAEAAAEHGRAIEAFEQLKQLDPTNPIHQLEFAINQTYLGEAYLGLKTWEQADTAFVKAEQIFNRLRTENELSRESDHAKLEYYAGMNLFNRGISQSYLGEKQQAGEYYHAANEVYRRLMAAPKSGSVPKFRSRLARSYFNLGFWQFDMKQYPQARDSFVSAQDHLDRLVLEYPFVLEYHRDLANCCVGLANTQFKLDEQMESWTLLAKAAQLLADNWRVAHQTQDYESFSQVCDFLQINGRLDEATPLISRFIDYCSDRNGEFGSAEQDRQRISRSLRLRRARLFQKASRFAEAADDLEVLATTLPEPQRRALMLECCCLRARTNDYEQAVRIVRQLVSGSTATGAEHYNASCVLALSASTAAQDEHVGQEVREQRRDEYATTAVAFLTTAKERGFFRDPNNLKHLHEDSDLEALHSRADYRAFIAQLTVGE